MLTIKILGPGCANCKMLEAVTRKVVDKMAVEAVITKVTDFNEMGNYSLMATPGLVINEKLVSSGRIPSTTEVTDWVTSALSARA